MESIRAFQIQSQSIIDHFCFQACYLPYLNFVVSFDDVFHINPDDSFFFLRTVLRVTLINSAYSPIFMASVSTQAGLNPLLTAMFWD